MVSHHSCQSGNKPLGVGSTVGALAPTSMPFADPVWAPGAARVAPLMRFGRTEDRCRPPPGDLRCKSCVEYAYATCSIGLAACAPAHALLRADRAPQPDHRAVT